MAAIGIAGLSSEATGQDRPFALLCGTLLDASETAPISDAMVYLSGTRFAAATDSSGGFCLERLPEGEYDLTLFHLALVGIEAPPPSVPITIASGATSIEWVIPSVVLGSEGLRAANPGEPYPLEPIIVSAEGAGPAAAAPSREGVSIAVIDQAEIDELLISARDVGDVLRHVSGLRTRRVGDILCLESRRRTTETSTTRNNRPPGFVRSYGAEVRCQNTPLVFVDGVLIDVPELYLSSLPAHQLGRVEFIPALAAGTRYGTGAAHGVLLIRTRSRTP